MTESRDTPPTLEYRAAADDRRAVRRIPGSLKAAVVTGVLAAVGMYLRSTDRHGGSLFIFPIILGGLTYIVARVVESSSPGALKFVKCILAVFAVVTACTLTIREQSVFTYARAYGWTSNQAFGEPGWRVLALALAVFAVVDVVDRLWRKRRDRVN